MLSSVASIVKPNTTGINGAIHRTFAQVDAILGGTERKGWLDADCPFCGKPTKRGQVHFSYRETGYHCFVCEASGNLFDLAAHLGLRSSSRRQASLQREELRREKKVALWSDYVDKTITENQLFGSLDAVDAEIDGNVEREQIVIDRLEDWIGSGAIQQRLKCRANASAECFMRVYAEVVARAGTLRVAINRDRFARAMNCSTSSIKPTRDRLHDAGVLINEKIDDGNGGFHYEYRLNEALWDAVTNSPPYNQEVTRSAVIDMRRDAFAVGRSQTMKKWHGPATKALGKAAFIAIAFLEKQGDRSTKEMATRLGCSERTVIRLGNRMHEVGVADFDGETFSLNPHWRAVLDEAETEMQTFNIGKERDLGRVKAKIRHTANMLNRWLRKPRHERDHDEMRRLQHRLEALKGRKARLLTQLDMVEVEDESAATDMFFPPAKCAAILNEEKQMSTKAEVVRIAEREANRVALGELLMPWHPLHHAYVEWDGDQPTKPTGHSSRPTVWFGKTQPAGLWSRWLVALVGGDTNRIRDVLRTGEGTTEEKSDVSKARLAWIMVNRGDPEGAEAGILRACEIADWIQTFDGFREVQFAVCDALLEGHVIDGEMCRFIVRAANPNFYDLLEEVIVCAPELIEECEDIPIAAPLLRGNDYDLFGYIVGSGVCERIGEHDGR